MRAGLAVALAAVTLAAACSSDPAPSEHLGLDLAGKVTAENMLGHLRKLAEIADANGGNRAEGTPGYDASVDYVAQFLRDKGFDVETPEYERLAGLQKGNPALTVAGRPYPVDQASLLLTTPRGGLTAPTLRPNRPAGCTAADYGSVAVKGAIAVVDDAGCSVVAKHDTAVARGAVGLLVVSAGGPNGAPRGLFTPGYYQRFTVPVGVIDKAGDGALRRTNKPVRLVLDGTPMMVKSRNVLAQTKSGDTRNVVMVGAHLDSVRSGPGINDDATGVAAVLETAAALGSEPAVTNAVRFALWGSQEPGAEGATKYVDGLDDGRRKDIALYLDVEMIGSPNPGYFTYDGDQSAQANPDIPAASVPAGSAGIERTLAGYLNLAGVRPADMPLVTTADYRPFLAIGVPVGGVTTGSSQRKSEVQARLWGGQAGVAFDPNYHTPRDNLDSVDEKALAVTGPAVAYAVGTYAQSTEGVNGVPPRD